MIDFNTYEEVKLEDVAEYARAKKVGSIQLVHQRYRSRLLVDRSDI